MVWRHGGFAGSVWGGRAGVGPNTRSTVISKVALASHVIATWKVPHGSCDPGRLRITAPRRRIESHETDQRGHLCAPDSIWGALSFFSCCLRRCCEIKIRADHSGSRSRGFRILTSGEFLCLPAFCFVVTIEKAASHDIWHH